MQRCCQFLHNFPSLSAAAVLYYRGTLCVSLSLVLRENFELHIGDIDCAIGNSVSQVRCERADCLYVELPRPTHMTCLFPLDSTTNSSPLSSPPPLTSTGLAYTVNDEVVLRVCSPLPCLRWPGCCSWRPPQRWLPPHL